MSLLPLHMAQAQHDVQKSNILGRQQEISPSEPVDTIIEIAINASGDTVYTYSLAPVPLESIIRTPISETADTHGFNAVDDAVIVSAGDAGISPAASSVGIIPFEEGFLPSGARTYTIPIRTAPGIKLTPDISLVYNSQSGNGAAGYGWNIVGGSAISLVTKNIHYDGTCAPIDLSRPKESAFALDGVRLVANAGVLASTYQYETARGRILVKKHMAGNNVAYFTVAYPDGNTATFGFADNTDMRVVYPITELKDIRGNTVSFQYTMSGNSYYLSRIMYGGNSASAHLAEIECIYEDRTDFGALYVSGLKVSADKILKKIISRTVADGGIQELCSYTLTHRGDSHANRLVRLDCSSGGDSLRPLTFSYIADRNSAAAGMERNGHLMLEQFFSEKSGAQPVFMRGKFVKDRYDDGIVTFPGRFTAYDIVGYRKSGSKLYPVFGSGFPKDQAILIASAISSLSYVDSIRTEAGFQTIQALDIDGDDTDEIVKVNISGNDKEKTTLTLKTYRRGNDGFTEQSFNVDVKGVVNSGNGTYSPMFRSYLWGDFRGDGKKQLLSVAHNVTSFGDKQTSYFALVDLAGKTLVSETSPFTFADEDMKCTFVLDVNGDGKAELCHVTGSNLDVYALYGNSFVKTGSMPFMDRSKFGERAFFGDINGDGYIDVVVSPEKSYEKFEDRLIPVWTPENCTSCGSADPIVDMSRTTCRFCNFNLKGYCLSKHYRAVCRRCGAALEVSADRKSASCLYDGESVNCRCDIGFVNNGNVWQTYTNTGAGFAVSSVTLDTRHTDDEYVLMDINRDGYADLVRSRNGSIEVFLSDRGLLQNEAACTVPAVQAATAASLEMLPANVCEYGSMSHFITIANADITCYSYSKDFVRDNLLTELTDSYGNVYGSEYGLLTSRQGCHQPAHSSYTYPYSPVLAPLYLLRQSTAKDSKASVYRNVSYAYTGAVANREGLGLVCFEKITTRDNLAKRSAEEVYDPLKLGALTMVSSADRVSHTVYRYNTEPSGKARLVPMAIFEDNLLANTKTVQTFAYDDYDNPLSTATMYGDAKTVRQNFEYRNTVSDDTYLLGLPTKTTTVATRTGCSEWTTSETTEYNSAYLPVKKTLYTGPNKANETRWTYDAHGNVTSEMSAPYDVKAFNGKAYEYDADGRYVTAVADELGLRTQYADFDKYGNARTVTDIRSNKTRIEYDAWGRQTLAVRPDGTEERTVAAWGGEGLYTVTKVQSGKPAVITHYDSRQRDVRTCSQRFDGKWQTVDKVYDERGRLSKVSLPFIGSAPACWNVYTYDDYDRPLSFDEASGKSTTWSYDQSKTTETKDGISTIRTVDASGCVVMAEDAGGAVVYNLRSDDQPESIVAPGNVVTSFAYDEYGRKTSVNDPSFGVQVTEEAWSADGSHTQTQTDADGRTTTAYYDCFGRKSREVRPEFVTFYDYDMYGCLKSVLSTNGTRHEYAYNDYGQTEFIESRIGNKRKTDAFKYQYGNVVEKTVHLVTESGDKTVDETYQYANGSLVRIALASGETVWQLLDENEFGQPAQIVTGTMQRKYVYTQYGLPALRIAGNIQSEQYQFDTRSGNLLLRVNVKRNQAERFGYDSLNRLVWANGRQVNYAANGNILARTDVGAYEYGITGKPYAVSGIAYGSGSYANRSGYDIEYNSLHRPASIDNGLKTTLEYDAAGDRVVMRKGSAEKFYLGEYEVWNSGERQVLYLAGDAYTAPVALVKNGGSADWQLVNICRDYLGSIMYIASCDGQLIAEYSYDAWGNLRDPQTWNNYPADVTPPLYLDRGYTGHEHLREYGLINMNARLYDPETGRFLSPDPYVQSPDFTQSYNRYTYCMNNPMKYVDESGEIAWFVPVAIGAVVGAYIGASVYSGTAAFWNWKPGAWKGAITGGIIGASIGFFVSSAIGANGLLATKTITSSSGSLELVFPTKIAGTTSSILYGGTTNILFNGLASGDWNSAWKAGVSGMVTGAWSITGGLGLVKGAGNDIAGLARKLGYQMIGTTVSSIGDNWTNNRALLSKLTIGIGPVNITIGKGQKLLQLQENMGNIIINSFGLANAALFGAKVSFDKNNLTLCYTGGMIDKLYPPSDFVSGFSPYTITGNSKLLKSNIYMHELHHLWHSRALSNKYLFNYALNGINSLLLNGAFVTERNYYETFADEYKWW